MWVGMNHNLYRITAESHPLQHKTMRGGYHRDQQ